jgi:hypothetical protein
MQFVKLRMVQVHKSDLLPKGVFDWHVVAIGCRRLHEPQFRQNSGILNDVTISRDHLFTLVLTMCLQVHDKDFSSMLSKILQYVLFEISFTGKETF